MPKKPGDDQDNSDSGSQTAGSSPSPISADEASFVSVDYEDDLNDGDLSPSPLQRTRKSLPRRPSKDSPSLVRSGSMFFSSSAALASSHAALVSSTSFRYIGSMFTSAFSAVSRAVVDMYAGYNNTDLNPLADPNISVLVDKDAIKQSGIPPQKMQDMLDLCKRLNIELSIRANQIGIPSKARYSDGDFDGKTTGDHTKSNKSDSPEQGHLGLKPQTHGIIPNVTDHNPDAGFPPGAEKKAMPADMSLDLDATAGSEIIEYAVWNNRHCYAIERDSYRQPEPGAEFTALSAALKDRESELESQKAVKANIKKDDEHEYEITCQKIDGKVYIKQGRQVDRYIQEAFKIKEILAKIASGTYEAISFTDGILEFGYSYENGKPSKKYTLSYQVDLRLNFPVTYAGNDDGWKDASRESTFDASGPDKSGVIVALDNFIGSNNIKIENLVSVFSSKDGNKIAPILIRGNPYPVTNDFDIMHLALPTDLPPEAFDIYSAFSVDGLGALQIKAEALLIKIFEDPEYKDKAHLRELCDALKVKKDTDGLDLSYFHGLLERVPPDIGSVNVGEFLYMCALNDSIKKRMFCHGAESRNPVNGYAKPEEFGGVTHLTKEGIIHTDDEETAINMYLHALGRLESHYREVNPYWIVKPRSTETEHLKAVWLDIVKMQALAEMDKSISNSFENMAQYNSEYAKLIKDGGEVKAILAEVAKLTKEERISALAGLKAKYESRAKIFDAKLIAAKGKIPVPATTRPRRPNQ